MSHIRHQVALLLNGVVGDWLSAGTWFGTCCAPGTRMWARGFVYALFVARTTWFSLPDLCSTNGQWALNAMKYVTALTYRWV